MAHLGLLEDNARIARLSATILQFSGHTVTIYDKGRALLDALHSFQLEKLLREPLSVPTLPLDTLILDLRLPDMDGIEVVRCLQSCSISCSLPIILCTAGSPSEIAQVLCIAPHVRVVEKPFKLQTLTDAVHEALIDHEASFPLKR